MKGDGRAEASAFTRHGARQPDPVVIREAGAIVKAKLRQLAAPKGRFDRITRPVQAG
jgi:hypothetical protein